MPRVAKLTSQKGRTFFVKEEEGCLEKVRDIVQWNGDRHDPILKTEIIEMTDQEYDESTTEELYENK